MFSSKLLRTTLLILLVGFLASCASIKSTDGTQEPSDSIEQAGEDNSGDQVVSDSSESKENDKESNEAAQPVRVAAVDPMKGYDTPLALIKIYDQVQGLVESKKVADAISLLNSTKSQFPNESGPSYRLARLYVTQKSYELALDSIEAAISISKANYYAMNLKGVILRELGKFNESKEAYLQAIDTYPDFANAHLNLAILADIYLYDLDLALKHFEEYMVLTGDKDKLANGWLIDLKRRMPKGGE